MPDHQTYPIGTPGTPWGAPEKASWLARQTRQRSYEADVLTVIENLRSRYEVVQYGWLDCDPARYPLMALRNPGWRNDLPVVLVTGGVHGYETSGVHGALRFLEKYAPEYQGRINLLVAPCVSPWAYETIQRWNMHAVDPNRSFFIDGTTQESAALIQLISPVREHVLVHIDLHETTDSDESEFRPALAAQDGVVYVPGVIPDGFYVVDDVDHPRTDFQSAVIAAVAEVTHIAPTDPDGKIIGSPVVARGVIQYHVWVSARVSPPRRSGQRRRSIRIARGQALSSASLHRSRQYVPRSTTCFRARPGEASGYETPEIVRDSEVSRAHSSYW